MRGPSPDFNIAWTKYLLGLLNRVLVRFARNDLGRPHNVVTFTPDNEAVIARCRMALVRRRGQKFDSAVAEPDWIALTALCQPDDMACNDFTCGGGIRWLAVSTVGCFRSAPSLFESDAAELSTVSGSKLPSSKLKGMT